MQRFADVDRERGSMLLALLLATLTLALGAVLLATTLGQAKKVRHDQGFTQVLPAADAGIQRGLFMLNNGGPATVPTATPTPIAQGAQTADWFATPQTNTKAPLSYLLSSTSRVTRRTVVAEAYQSKRFAMGAFADKSFIMRGGNNSNSYDSGAGSTATTGHGRVGSNGSVRLDGNATADGVDLYDWTNNPNPSRCTGGPCSSGYDTYPNKYDISSPASYAFITAQLAACTTATAFQTSSTAGHMLPAGTWCASSLNFDADTTVTGPTAVFVSGNVTMSPHVNVNYTSGVAAISANLQIYTLGSSVDISNHNNVGAAIYAPLATCSGGAQDNIYGAMICSTISSVGGWQFHYDEALGNLGAGDFRLRHYREQ